ncbi:MAG TPA: glycosyltransferase [Bryobacteraceae bacterium]|nr:glycosyltransferase [Bryobacteraceae bacterium]
MHTEPRIDFIYFEAGGGHKAAANALQSVIASEGYQWDIRLVNLQEVLDPLDVFRKVTGIRLEDLYNRMLAKGWTLGSAQLLPMMQSVIRLYHKPAVDLLADFWKQRKPDIVVSLIPNLNRALFESVQRSVPGTPYVTILTDLADYPPHFWMEKQEQYFVCGTERACQQAAHLGHQPQHIFPTSGMILRPAFYQMKPVDKAAERKRLGLQPDLPTGIVLFGGEGSNAMFSIAQQLGNADFKLQLILICGRNKRLKGRLEQLKTKNPMFVEGFTKEIPFYMSISDFFIGKPGPGSISEALKVGLPVIVTSNAWTLPQERFNAEWVNEQQVGIVLKNFGNIAVAVKSLLESDQLSRMRARILKMDNRAVYEIPPILEQIRAMHGQRSEDTLLAPHK